MCIFKIVFGAYFTRKALKATKASMEFHEILPSPHALRSVAEGIQMKQPGTRIHKDTKTSRVEVKSNLEKKKQKDCSKVGSRLSTQKNLPEQ